MAPQPPYHQERRYGAPPPYPPPYRPRRHHVMGDPIVRVIIGVAVVIVAIVAFNTDLVVGLGNGAMSLSQSHSLCSGDLGGLAQIMSAKARDDCGMISAAYWGVWVVLALGLALAVWGAYEHLTGNRGQ